jgi:hypothetical protein
MVNPDRQGQLLNYMGVEDMMLPGIYVGLLVTSVLLLWFWLFELKCNWTHVTGIHVACAMSLVVRTAEGLAFSLKAHSWDCSVLTVCSYARQVKVIEMGLESSYYKTLNREGQVPYGLNLGSEWKAPWLVARGYALLALSSVWSILSQCGFSCFLS